MREFKSNIVKYCKTCDSLFKVKPGTVGKFCSRECYWNSKNRIDQDYKCLDCGVKVSPVKSVKRCRSCEGKQRAGRNHHKWIEDRSKLKTSDKKHLCYRYNRWMLSVKNRDGWRCQISDNNCKGRLESHHILNWVDYPELRYEVNNGITLCAFHHPRKRKDEKQLAPIFRELVEAVN